MTEPATVGTVAASNGTPPPDAPRLSSRLQQLKDEFNQQVTDPRLFKRLPAVKGRLTAEYRVLTAKETQDALQADGNLEQNQDVLVAALVALHAHDPEHDDADKRGLVDLRKWLEIDTVTPLKFDKRLTDALGLVENTAREIVLRMFNGNEIALSAQAAQLMAWMTDTSEESLQDFTAGS